MNYSLLLYQLPAIFAAVPMVHRLLPFSVAARAVPLMYFLVALVVMALPGSVCVALGAAGLIAMLHVRLGEHPSKVSPPDMEEVLNKFALAYDYIVGHLLVLTDRSKQEPIVDDSPEDGKPEHAEPPPPLEHPIRQHIPHLD
jgi:hypothetical protein